MRWRGLLVAVLMLAVAVNAALIVDVLMGGGLLPVSIAASDKQEAREGKKKSLTPQESAKEAEEAYRALVAELTEQKASLEKKSKELAERERQINVIREELRAQKDQAAASAAAQPAQPVKSVPTTATDAFKKLVKAYSGMDADQAAKAYAELYGRDRDVAIDLMLALPARKASALMNELTTLKPALAGDVSVEMSHRDEPKAQ